MSEESTLDPYTLTAPGWPRPVIGGYPIPWVAPAERLSEVNEGRRLASVGGAVCQVCGESFSYDEPAYGFTTVAYNGVESADLPIEYHEYLSALPGYPPGSPVLLLDGAVMHDRCAKLTAAMCPHVRDRETLICVRVPANDADPKELDGKLVPTYPAGDVEYVAWPVRRRGARHAD